MTVQDYKDRITKLLRGENLPGRVPHERLDWGGLAGVVALYYGTDDTNDFRAAMKSIIREESDVVVLAQVIHFASSLRLWDVTDAVESRKGQFEANSAAGASIQNFLAFRQLDKSL